MKNKIIIATGNEGKLKEIKMMFSDMDLEIISLKETGIDIEIDENGTSFEENAIIKAQAIANVCNEIVLADDSGLVIDALDGEPGIYSARYLGEETSYIIKNNVLLNRMQGISGDDRAAHFVCAMAVAFPNGEVEVTKGIMDGRIAYQQEGGNGFGYDPIFELPEYGCTSAQLDSLQKNRISHRGKALEEMKKVLIKRFA